MGGVQHIVVMGVSGSGKTTTGSALAARLGWPFIEGDAFHPAQNLALMRAGIALSDADRAPWLRALAAEIARHQAQGQGVVVACSALKRTYRDILRGAAPRVRFVHVHGDRAVLDARLAHRRGHFFPAALLQSQLATLEPLAPDEDGVTIDIALPVAREVDQALRLLALDGSGGGLSALPLATPERSPK